MAANLNKYNFLRWFDGCDNVDSNAIPRIYVRDPSACYPILLYPGERTSFYLNFNVAVDYTFTVYLMKDNVIVGSALCTLTQIEIDTDLYEYYGQFTCPSVANGYYRLGLYSGSDLMAVSNVLEVTRDISKSVYVRFRHGKQMYGFNYNLVPSFYNEFRLNIYEADRQVDYNMDQYRSVSTNKIRNYDKRVDRFLKFETYYFDEGAHEACEVMIAHDEIYINSKKFNFKEGYKSNLDPQSKLSKGEFQLYEEQYSIDSKYDNTATVSLAPIYYNTEQSDTFRKNNCPEGYTGSDVTYTVKAGSYCSMTSQEAANNLALAEITANGQAYANLHGTCIQSTVIFNYTFENLDALLIESDPDISYAIESNKLRISWSTLPSPESIFITPLDEVGQPITLLSGNYIISLNISERTSNLYPVIIFNILRTEGSIQYSLSGTGLKEYAFTCATDINAISLLISSGGVTDAATLLVDDWKLIKLP